MLRFLRQSSVSLLFGVIFGCSVIAFLNQSRNLRLHQQNVANVDKKQGPKTIKSHAENVIVEKRGKDLHDKVRILCWVMTNPSNHETKALAVKETWGPRCNVLLFMSSKNDTKLPTVALPVGEGRDELWGKTREAFRYVWEHYHDKVDWFLKADDDTYVIVENLRYFLSGFNTSKPLFFGHKFKAIVKSGYFSGGAGYALSKEAARRFATIGYHNASLCRKDHGGSEDAEMGYCMEKLNVSAMDTRDSQGRGRFFPFGADSHYFPGPIHAGDYWYWDYIYYPPTQACISYDSGLIGEFNVTISFHYIDQRTMYMLDLFFYQIRPYGLVDNRPAIPEPPPDVNLTAPRWFAPPKPTTTPPPTTIPTSTKSPTTLKPNTTTSQTTLKPNITSQTSAPVTTKQVDVQKTVDSNSTMAFRYAWERYQDEVDWFLKADDDTYVIVENLRYFLSGFNTAEPLYFGHKFKAIVKSGFFSGGAGYALSKEATRRFVTIGYPNASLCRKDHGGAEDVEMANCMEKLNVSAMDTRDSQGRGRFFPYGASFHYFPSEIYADVHWYWNAIYYPPTQGRNCCSDSTISFHYIDPNTMYMLDLFFYQIRPYGLVDNRPAIPEPPPDVNLTAPRWYAPKKPTPPPPPTTIPTLTKSTTSSKPNTTTSQTSSPSTKKVEAQKTVDSKTTMVNASTTKKN
ncbi:hypothetical protein GHT06_015821 [Daphnia sinensis]|uniref:Glycoprotein-N-acetylgalactosamine 3-beta-galactosyltransferase 1 n=1 Tax=Daphnia sinensis TaxID=1820382 RepID=A0AAD5KRP7_9CRUS|nr:hypothetical protein GHT06_015821 [Daphnia sinensis]